MTWNQARPKALQARMPYHSFADFAGTSLGLVSLPRIIEDLAITILYAIYGLTQMRVLGDWNS